jgi:rhodanese-related sulfurtransferase
LPNELQKDEEVVVDDVKNNPETYNIIDVRNASEYATGAFFPNSKNIPLPELRKRLDEVKDDKPILVHCAGGYRSAVGSSIIESKTNQKVYDLSDAVEEFK